MGPYWQLTVCVELPGGTWKSLSLFIFHHCLLFSSWWHTCKGKKTLTKFFFLIQHMFSFIKKEFQIPTWVEITIFSIFPHMFFGSQIQNSNWSFLFVQAQNECAYWLSDGCQLQCIQVKLLTEDVRWSEATHLIRHHFHVMHCAHVWSFSFVTAE